MKPPREGYVFVVSDRSDEWAGRIVEFVCAHPTGCVVTRHGYTRVLPAASLKRWKVRTK